MEIVQSSHRFRLEAVRFFAPISSKKIVRLLSNQRMSPVELPYGDSAIHSTTCIRANDV